MCLMHLFNFTLTCFLNQFKFPVKGQKWAKVVKYVKIQKQTRTDDAFSIELWPFWTVSNAYLI